MTRGPAQRRAGEELDWRAEPPEGAWERVGAEDSGRLRRPLVLAAAAAIGVGIVAILVPAVASVGTAIFIGFVLVGASAAVALDAVAAHGIGRKLLRALIALATFAAGLYMLVSPLEGAFTLTVMLVIWFVAIGVAQIAAGIGELGSPGAGYTIAAGATSLVLGVLIGRELPSSADWAIGLLVGIQFIVYGLLSLGQATLRP